MNMNNSFKEIFGHVQAEEELKNRTMDFLAEKTHGYDKADIKKPRYYYYAAVCAACVLLMLFGGHWLYFTSIAEISIDINPSIELSVNRFDQVISVNDFNEDGQALAKAIDVKHKNYTDAIDEILNSDMITALLSDNEIMTITVAGSDGEKSAKILSEVEICTAEQRNTYCYNASSEDAAAAHEIGLSCGKYRAYSELKQLDPSITPEAVQSMTMREIRERIDSFSNDSENNIPSDNNQNYGDKHHGQGNGYGEKHGNKKAEQHHLND